MSLPRFAAGDLTSSSTKLRAEDSVSPNCVSAVCATSLAVVAVAAAIARNTLIDVASLNITSPSVPPRLRRAREATRGRRFQLRFEGVGHSASVFGRDALERLLELHLISTIGFHRGSDYALRKGPALLRPPRATQQVPVARSEVGEFFSAGLSQTYDLPRVDQTDQISPQS